MKLRHFEGSLTLLSGIFLLLTTDQIAPKHDSLFSICPSYLLQQENETNKHIQNTPKLKAKHKKHAEKNITSWDQA